MYKLKQYAYTNGSVIITNGQYEKIQIHDNVAKTMHKYAVYC